jgi:hypothetical protein
MQAAATGTTFAALLHTGSDEKMSTAVEHSVQTHWRPSHSNGETNDSSN